MISESDFSGVLVVVVEDGQALGSWSEVEKTNGDYAFKKLDGKKMEIVWYLVVKKVKGPENTQKKKKKNLISLKRPQAEKVLSPDRKSKKDFIWS